MAERHTFVRLAEETMRKHIQEGRIVSRPDDIDDLDIRMDVQVVLRRRPRLALSRAGCNEGITG